MRLADTSIWIAFKDLGKLDALLSVPGIAIARPVVGELRRGRDDMAGRIAKALSAVAFDVDISDALSDTLADILRAADRRLSEVDALQVAYACANAGSVVLYMRDGPGERQATRIGAPVRNHRRLVADMVELAVVSLPAAGSLEQALEGYFARGRLRHRP